jgi:hypothetical protein
MYYRATVIIENKSNVDPDDLFDELYGLSVGKGKIIETESVEEADDFDDSNVEGLSSMDEDRG